jgi:hypothetical protein
VSDMVEQRVHVSRDVTFNKQAFCSWDSDGDEEQNVEPFTVEHTYTEPKGVQASVTPPVALTTINYLYSNGHKVNVETGKAPDTATMSLQ